MVNVVFWTSCLLVKVVVWLKLSFGESSNSLGVIACDVLPVATYFYELFCMSTDCFVFYRMFCKCLQIVVYVYKCLQVVLYVYKCLQVVLYYLYFICIL